jgi:hypothetical protein
MVCSGHGERRDMDKRDIRQEFMDEVERQLNPATRSTYRPAVSVKTPEELEYATVKMGFKSHEPDEQGITARVFGVDLDSSGAWNRQDVSGLSFEELHTVVYVEGCAVIAVNLSDLLEWGAFYAPALRRERIERVESRPTRSGSLLHRLVEARIVRADLRVKEWDAARALVAEHIDGPGAPMVRARRIVDAMRGESLLTREDEPLMAERFRAVAKLVLEVNEEA